MNEFSTVRCAHKIYQSPLHVKSTTAAGAPDLTTTYQSSTRMQTARRDGRVNEIKVCIWTTESNGKQMQWLHGAAVDALQESFSLLPSSSSYTALTRPRVVPWTDRFGGTRRIDLLQRSWRSEWLRAANDGGHSELVRARRQRQFSSVQF